MERTPLTLAVAPRGMQTTYHVRNEDTPDPDRDTVRERLETGALDGAIVEMLFHAVIYRFQYVNHEWRFVSAN